MCNSLPSYSLSVLMSLQWFYSLKYGKTLLNCLVLMLSMWQDLKLQINSPKRNTKAMSSRVGFFLEIHTFQLSFPLCWAWSSYSSHFITSYIIYFFNPNCIILLINLTRALYILLVFKELILVFSASLLYVSFILLI